MYTSSVVEPPATVGRLRQRPSGAIPTANQYCSAHMRAASMARYGHIHLDIGCASGPQDTRLIHRISLRGTPSVFATRGV